jgi:hypothetical protein
MHTLMHLLLIWLLLDAAFVVAVYRPERGR